MMTCNQTARVPQRTCVACRQVRAKKELVRLVRTPTGPIEVDASGRKVGRGAYLCPSRECWLAGIKTRALDRALKINLSEEDRQQVTGYAANLHQGVK